MPCDNDAKGFSFASLGELIEKFPKDALVEPDLKNMAAALCRWFDRQQVTPAQAIIINAVIAGLLINWLAYSMRNDSVRLSQLDSFRQLTELFASFGGD